jgi:lipoprotein signal peptidase
VLDFVDVSFGTNLRWPTFNLADVAITIGSLILAGSLIRAWVRRARLERAG